MTTLEDMRKWFRGKEIDDLPRHSKAEPPARLSNFRPSIGGDFAIGGQSAPEFVTLDMPTLEMPEVTMGESPSISLEYERIITRPEWQIMDNLIVNDNIESLSVFVSVTVEFYKPYNGQFFMVQISNTDFSPIIRSVCYDGGAMNVLQASEEVFIGRGDTAHLAVINWEHCKILNCTLSPTESK